MNKDSQVKLGSTACDFCSSPATQVREKLVLCDKHAAEQSGLNKSAAAGQVPLRAAPIMFSDKHR